MLIYLAGVVLVFTGRFFDEILYPGYRKQKVEAPIFILANPRSGTTFLQRAMCTADPGFTSFRTYQVIFPSIFLYRFADSLRRLDPYIGNPVRRMTKWIDRAFFGVFKGIHETGMNYLEEDEGMFAYTLYTPGVYLFFPFIDELNEVQAWDDLPQGQRDRLVAYYRSSLRRHMYAVGSDKILLIKNVFSIGRIHTLMDAFPDARFILLVRRPEQALPSMVSFFDAVWRVHSPDVPQDESEAKQLANMGKDYYRRLYEIRRDGDPERIHFIRYEDLISDTMAVVKEVYDHFDLTWTAEIEERLEELVTQSKDYKSKNRYTLQMYGLSREWVFRDMEEVFASFGYSR
jgi:hypothetical protein